MCQETILDSILFSQAPWQHDTLQKGVIYQHFHFDQKQLFASNQNINIIRVQKTNKKVQWKIATGGKQLIKTSELAKNYNAISGVNGGFFNIKNGGSVNFLRINGQITDTSYTEKNGGGYSLQQSGVFAFNDQEFVILKRKEKTIAGKWEENIPYPNIMESGPILLSDYTIENLTDTPFNTNRHPRTCVCITKDETILLTADGRNAMAQGLSLPELAQVLSWLGCKDGLNLDGGGSTTFYLDQNGVVNMPSDNKLWDHEGERAVSNALLLVVRQ